MFGRDGLDKNKMPWDQSWSKFLVCKDLFEGSEKQSGIPLIRLLKRKANSRRCELLGLNLAAYLTSAKQSSIPAEWRLKGSPGRLG